MSDKQGITIRQNKSENPDDYRITLKNIYRLIKQNDYPVFSDGICSRSQKKGLTLITFWNDQLLFRWRNTAIGQRIWRVEGSKNRYHSELCNRKERFPFYQEYLQEILDGITPEEFFRQSQLIAQFFITRSYNHEVLLRKMTSLITLAKESDPFFPLQIAGQLTNCVSRFEGIGKDMIPYYDGYVLSVLTLCAIAGPEAVSPAFIKLLTAQQYQAKVLFHQYLLKAELSPENKEVLLTGPNCELLKHSLPLDHFYGREREIYDLEDAFASRQKLLICGTGGIGKTELLRQFLSRIRSRQLLNVIAAVQYQDTLVDSFARSFTGLSGANATERFHEAVSLLKTTPESGTILLIDNIDQISDDDSIWQEITALPCCVMVTSRLENLPGFDSSRKLKAPERKSAALIFRRNYGKILTDQEKDELDQLIETHRFYHPLTLSVLGRAAGMYHWSLTQLTAKCEKADIHSVYHQLFSDQVFTLQESGVIRLFSILPYQGYSPEMIRHFWNLSSPVKLLEHLSRSGWLESHDGTYSMHPVIAESIRVVAPAQKEFQSFWDYAQNELHPDFTKETNTLPKEASLAFAVMQAVMNLPGEISEDLTWLLACCLYLLWDYRATSSQTIFQVSDFAREHAANNALSDRTQILFETILMSAETFHQDVCSALYEKYKYMFSSGNPLLLLFGMNYALCLVENGQYKTAEEICTQLLLCGPSPALQISIYQTIAMVYLRRGDYEKGTAIMEQMIEQHQNMKTGQSGQVPYELISLYLSAGEANLRSGNITNARKYLKQARSLFPKGEQNSVFLIMETSLEGEIALAEGKTVSALNAFLSLQKLSEIYYGASSDTFLTSCVKLGMVYLQMGGQKAPDAIASFQKALQICEENYPESAYLQVVMNNLGVAFLDNNQPDEARPYLENAYEAAREMAPIARAESAWNLSRLHRMKNDTEKEKKYLAEACPVFLETYGPEHPKTLKAKQRMDELGCGAHIIR